LLAGDIRAEVWDGDVSNQLGDIILDELLLNVSHYDFAILVLSADDLTTSKRKRKESPRDNVIFELGMFMGVRGRRHVFPIIVPGQAGDLKVPTDLAGNKVLHLDPDRLANDQGYLSEQVGIVKTAILARFRQASLSLLPSAALAHGYYHNFLVPVSDHLSAGETRNPEGAPTYNSSDYDFNIYMPANLVDADPKKRDLTVQRLGLKPFAVGRQPSANQPSPRPYPFFVKPEIENGRTQFVDLPTTIRTSYDIINLALRDGLGEKEELRTLMGDQERLNFAKAINLLLRGPEASFPNKVRLWWISEETPSTPGAQHDAGKMGRATTPS
jgi:hypothetical protein